MRRGIAHRPRPARRSEPSTKAERQSSDKCDEGQDSRRPGNDCGDGSRNNGGKRRVDRVHEAKPAPNEVAGQDEADDAGGKSNKKLQHIEFPELRSARRHITERPDERFSSNLLPTCRGRGMRIAGEN
jgi:hypothetical protein